MFVMILLGVIVGIVINNLFPGLNRFLLTAIRLLILPLVVGLGYEFIMFAGKHDNVFTRILSAPGLWMQRITTKEPTEDMLEIAIISLKCALRDDFPEFKEFYELKAWEPKAQYADEAADCCDKASENADESDASTELTNESDNAEAIDESSAENKTISLDSESSAKNSDGEGSSESKNSDDAS